MANTPSKFNAAADAYLHSIWSERELGMKIPAIDWDKPIRHSDVLFLLRQYAYLQVINSEADWENVPPLQFRIAPSGWVIHDYHEAISASPGPLLYGPGNPEFKVRSEKEGEEGEGERGTGSITQQTVDTAMAIVHLAIEKGWAGLEIISGTDLMKWAAWFAARGLDYPIHGYEATEKDEEKRQRIIRLRREGGIPTLGPTPGT